MLCLRINRIHMFIGKKIELPFVWFFGRKNILFTAALSSVVVLLHHYAGFQFIGIPFLPVATIGTAVAFYVGFKNNQAYDRLWEARRLWGGFTNGVAPWLPPLFHWSRTRTSKKTSLPATSPTSTL